MARAAAGNGDVVSAQIRSENGVTAYLNAILVTPLYLRFTAFGDRAWVEVRNETPPATPAPFSDAEKIANIALLEAICASAASGRPACIASARAVAPSRLRDHRGSGSPVASGWVPHNRAT